MYVETTGVQSLDSVMSCVQNNRENRELAIVRFGFCVEVVHSQCRRLKSSTRNVDAQEIATTFASISAPTHSNASRESVILHSSIQRGRTITPYETRNLYFHAQLGDLVGSSRVLSFCFYYLSLVVHVSVSNRPILCKKSKKNHKHSKAVKEQWLA